ncbi:VOC family protein [Halodurantibacterium flavum]|uniref:VOC family protein n=1 Tax=Halodurantibacterium flavum TaxID=1382802 RepID=A0ABW4RZJ0_9RHOB
MSDSGPTRGTSGIHHVTGITGNVQANVDFYAGFLGLKLVKQTAGYADDEQLHLVYGDNVGSPGSLLTFLVWEATGRGRTGLGQVLEVSLAIPPHSVADWLTKALMAKISFEGPSREFGEPVLRLKDPDGMTVKLVGVDMPTAAPLADAPLRLRGVTLLSEQAALTAEFITRFGYRYGEREGTTQRMVSDTDAVDVRGLSGFVPSVPGAGVPDHVAFRAQDAGAVQTMRQSLKDHGPTEVHDRRYFLSLYVRDPAGILLEYATDGPGMAVDEAPDDLGRTLQMPPGERTRAEDIKALLPQFSMPGEERFPARDLPFVHRFNRPDDPDGTTLVLLHGTGGNEADLLPVARRMAPRATLLGVRGRAAEAGTNQWFSRVGFLSADQEDLRREADAFAAFVDGAVAGYGLDPNKLAFIGYSNGATFLAAVLRLHPGVLRRVILLRGREVLQDAEDVDLAGARVLTLAGQHDFLADKKSALAESLGARGAAIEARVLPVGHDISDADVKEAGQWLRQHLAGGVGGSVPDASGSGK